MEETIKCEIIKGEDIIPDISYKIIVIGEAFVGKSCLMIRAVKNEYREDYEVTIGADSSSLLVKINSKTVELQIWDTAGTEKFRSMIRVFFNNCNAAFLVYDITREATFQALDFWLKMLRDNTGPETKVILVGNKKDEETKRQVSYEEGKKFAEKNKLFEFMETSAKTGEGVLEVFKKVAKSLYVDIKDGEESPRKRLRLSKQIRKEEINCC